MDPDCSIKKRKGLLQLKRYVYILLYPIVLLQLISGETGEVNRACKIPKEAVALRDVVRLVGGTFHSNLMEPAREELALAIDFTRFGKPACFIYQQLSAVAVMDPGSIKKTSSHR
jgi:malonyl CoA-acyl carrier protein transacylase